MTVRSIAANKEEELRFLILATDGCESSYFWSLFSMVLSNTH